MVVGIIVTLVILAIFVMELVLELQDLLLKEYVGRSVLLFLGNWRLVFGLYWHL